MARVTRFDFQFPGMRKPDNFIVYPESRFTGDREYILVQGDRTIAAIYGDGVGWLNFRGSHSKYGVHLSPALGAQWVTFPVEFLRLVIENRPKSGDLIGANVYIA